MQFLTEQKKLFNKVNHNLVFMFELTKMFGDLWDDKGGKGLIIINIIMMGNTDIFKATNSRTLNV